MFTSTNDIFIGRQERVPAKVIDTLNGALLMYDNETISCIYNEKININVPIDKIIGACSISRSMFVLYKDGDNFIVREIESDGTSRNYIVKAQLSDNIVFGACDKLYIKTDNSLIILDHKSSSVLDGANIIMRIYNIYETSFSCSGVITVGNKILLPINGTNKIALIDEEMTVIKIDDVIFDGYNFHVSLGEKNANDSRCFLLAMNNGISIIDFEDFSSTHIPVEYNDISHTVVDDENYYLIDGKLVVMNAYFDNFVINTNIKGTYKIYSVNNDIYYYNNTTCYKLEECNDKAVVAIYCYDMVGDIIREEERVVKKESTIRINAPIIESFTLNGSSYIDITTSSNEENYKTEFTYALNKEVYTVTCSHVSFGVTIFTQSLSGFYGEEYLFYPERIQGYSFSHSTNIKGRFGYETAAYVYYISGNDEDNYLLDVTAKTSDLNVRRCLPIDKDVRRIIPPDIPFHKSKSSSISFSPSSDLNFIDIEYEPTCNTKPCSILLNGIKLYTSFCKICDDGYLEFDEAMFEIDKVKETTMKIERINVNTNSKITMTRYVNEFNSEIIASIISEYGRSDALVNIENYKFIGQKTSVSGALSIVDNFYSKINSTITINHIDATTKESIKNSVSLTGKVWSKISYNEPNIDGYLCITPNKTLLFENNHTDYNIEYTKKYDIMTYIYKDLHSKNIIKKEIHKVVDGEQSPKETMQHILSEVPRLMISGEYCIFCHQDYEPVVSTSYKTGSNIVNVKSSNMHEQRMISIIDGIEQNNPICLIEPVSSYTVDFLNKNGIQFEIVDSIPSKRCVLIDGCIQNKISNLDNSIPTNVLYVPLHVHYNDLLETIKLSKKSSLLDIDIPYTSNSDIDIDITMSPTSLDLSGTVSIDCTITHKKQSSIQVTVIVINPITLDKVCEKNIYINTSPRFNFITYTIDSVTNSSTDGTIRVKTNGQHIVPLDISISAIDPLGNKSKTKNIYKEVYTKNIHQTHKPVAKYRPSVPRVNNRYNGIKESLKYINTMDGLDRAIDEITDIIKGSIGEKDEI